MHHLRDIRHPNAACGGMANHDLPDLGRIAQTTIGEQQFQAIGGLQVPNGVLSLAAVQRRDNLLCGNV